MSNRKSRLKKTPLNKYIVKPTYEQWVACRTAVQCRLKKPYPTILTIFVLSSIIDSMTIIVKLTEKGKIEKDEQLCILYGGMASTVEQCGGTTHVTHPFQDVRVGSTERGEQE